MNATAATIPANESEFELAGLTPLSGEVVNAPRVAESAVQMECTLAKDFRLGEETGGATVIIGKIERIHLDDAIHDGTGRIDAEKYMAVGNWKNIIITLPKVSWGCLGRSNLLHTYTVFEGIDASRINLSMLFHGRLLINNDILTYRYTLPIPLQYPCTPYY